MIGTKEKDAEYLRIAMRAAGIFDKVGKVSKPAMAQQIAMVEMMLFHVREGDLRPAEFLPHPPHLPDGDELKSLVSSEVTKDAVLRQDAQAWRAMCRDEVSRASTRLLHAIEAVRIADGILNDEPGDAGEELYGWMHEIMDYLHAVFAVDLREAPTDRHELEEWCVKMMNRSNPVPEWLQEWSTRKVFTPTPKRKPSDHGKLAGRILGERDDD